MMTKAKTQPLIFIVENDSFYLNWIEYNLAVENYRHLRTFQTGTKCLDHMYLLPDVVILGENLKSSQQEELVEKITDLHPDVKIVYLNDDPRQYSEKIMATKSKSDLEDVTYKQVSSITERIKYLKEFVDMEATKRTTNKVGYIVAFFVVASMAVINYV